MSRSLGTPTWIDIKTTDLAATQTLCEKLFGWSFEDSGEEYGHYQMIRRDDQLVAGGMDTSAMSGPDGKPMPSAWTVYLAVDDIDARLALAEQHGGHVVVPAGDVGDAGRFAVITDPTGAVVGLWQADKLDGYDFSGEPGTPVWFELMTQDIEAAEAFYREVFGFTPVRVTSLENPDWKYSTNGPQEQASSGMCDVAGFIPAEVGSFWRVYFCVENCDAAAQQVQNLGGRLLDGPIDSPFGRVATVAEPSGASFQIIDPSSASPDRPMR